MTIKYLEAASVTDKKQTITPRNYSRTGYGKKLPTSWLLKIDKIWHRVYVVCFSNSGSAYVKVKGEDLFLGSYDPRD